jgi:hypothetical protein
MIARTRKAALEDRVVEQKAGKEKLKGGRRAGDFSSTFRWSIRYVPAYVSGD